MTESLSEKNARFIAFYEDLVESAISPPNRIHQGLQSKVLLASIFDSLSKSGVQLKGNGPRFRATVDEHTAWLDRERVSLLHLVRAFELAERAAPPFDSLRAWAESKYTKHFPLSGRMLSNHATIEQDPLLSEVEAMWPRQASGAPQPLGSLMRPEHLQHKNLLWLYRNSLVHEYRIPGRGAERATIVETEPYYQEVSTITSVVEGRRLTYTNKWELVYPTGFFHRLALEALTSIARLHAQNKTSPFEAYSQGTYWLPEFNESES